MNKFENIDIYTADPCVAMDMVARTPWDHYVPPYEVVSGVYSVSGIEWVSSFLIDTGDGLILIDTGLHESVYLLIDSIYRLGFKLNDIRMILLSHMLYACFSKPPVQMVRVCKRVFSRLLL